MASKAPSKPEIVEVNEDDSDDEEIDEEQLEDYRDMVENLGNFPDKVKISSLSMVAEDFSESKKGARTLYNVIRDRIMKGTREKLLPLVYAIDSIVKNAKGHFVKLVEDDAENWLPLVFQTLQENQRLKLQKVWKTWGDSSLFAAEKLKLMGRCFDKTSNAINHTTSTEVAGITRTSDGNLVLPRMLREEMQNLLDDMQTNVNEVDKISLERLAYVNPSLLAKVKKTAEDGLASGRQHSGQANGGGNQASAGNAQASNAESSSLPAFLTETRTPQQVQRAKEWAELSAKTKEDAPTIAEDLLDRVRKCGDTQYTHSDAMSMTQYMACASAAAQLLKTTLERIKTESNQKKNAMLLTTGASGGHAPGDLSNIQAQLVDPSQFTNDGVKTKNASVISMLYEVGLPFVSSADGRRFRTQLELSKHLDSLFKRNQLEKSMTATEERGWCEPDVVWAGEAKPEDMVTQFPAEMDPSNPAAAATAGSANNAATEADVGDGYSPETSTVPADEAREVCVICGTNFKMFFDNDNGIYMYQNCREIELENDEMALYDSDQVLVHVTCWRGLGSPNSLTMDQVLQDVIHH